MIKTYLSFLSLIVFFLPVTTEAAQRLDQGKVPSSAMWSNVQGNVVSTSMCSGHNWFIVYMIFNYVVLGLITVLFVDFLYRLQVYLREEGKEKKKVKKKRVIKSMKLLGKFLAVVVTAYILFIFFVRKFL